ncbi:MAG: tetratricopeptide repeat protein [Planctomycetota bacterium]
MEVLAVLWARRPALGRVLSPVIRRVASGSGESRVPHSAVRFLRWWRDGGRGVDEACAYNLRGLCVLAEGRPAEAEAEFERALELDPWFAAAAFNLAVARHRSDAPGDPAEPLRRVAAASGEEPDGWLLLGEFLERTDRVEEAEEVVRRALRVEPMHAQACLTLGRLLMAAGRLEEAEDVLQRALAAAAGHPDALINLALVHLESGRPADAVPLLRTAVNASDGDRREEARYLLHVAFRDVEQHDRALEVLDEVPDRFLRRNEHLMEEAAGYLEERRRFDRSQRLWERLREMRARRGEL